MSFTIRKAEKKDMPKVLSLIKELAEFEKEPDAVEVDENNLIENGFGAHPLFTCFVAEIENEIKGMALFYFRYSTWKGKTVHLEDLIIKKAYRGMGLGKALYRKVMEFAVEHQIKRVEWVVLDWNKNAVNFYKKTGATVFEEWNTVQFEEKAMKVFLDKV